jgi:hypothetical protein
MFFTEKSIYSYRKAFTKDAIFGIGDATKLKADKDYRIVKDFVIKDTENDDVSFKTNQDIYIKEISNNIVELQWEKLNDKFPIKEFQKNIKNIKEITSTEQKQEQPKQEQNIQKNKELTDLVRKQEKINKDYRYDEKISKENINKLIKNFEKGIRPSWA